MPLDVKQRLQFERRFMRLVQLNDAIVQQMSALAPILDWATSLTAGGRAKLNEFLGAMGIDVSNWDALIMTLTIVRQSIENNLQLQQP